MAPTTYNLPALWLILLSLLRATSLVVRRSVFGLASISSFQLGKDTAGIYQINPAILQYLTVEAVESAFVVEVFRNPADQLVHWQGTVEILAPCVFAAHFIRT